MIHKQTGVAVAIKHDLHRQAVEVGVCVCVDSGHLVTPELMHIKRLAQGLTQGNL